MKKMISCLMMLVSLAAVAQNTKKVFFYVQGGYKSSGYIKAHDHNEIISETEKDHHKCIILNVGMLVTLSEKWRTGLAFTYDHFGTKHRSVEYSNISYMVRVDRIWGETKNYLLYSGLSLGLRKIREFEEEIEVERRLGAGYQVYLAGGELKINKFMIDVNAGYGVSGVFNAGVKYQFY